VFYFIISRILPGLGLGTFIPASDAGLGCQGFTEPNLSTLLNKIKHPLFEKRIFD